MAEPLTGPQTAEFPTSGGVQTHNVGNPTEQRFAIKIKTSDNNLYKVSPVYAFIEPGHAIPVTITRSAGGAKEDKMVVQHTAVTDDVKEPKDAFTPGQAYPELPITLSAK